MAIGKAGAYATVEGPKVDFGDIALNAQKIQQADLDRMKSMIPEPKKSSYEYEKVDGITEVSNVAVYDKAMTENVSKLTERANELNKAAEAAGGWSAEGRAELNSINNSIKTYNASTKLFTEKAKAFSEDYSKGIYSGLGEKNMNYLEELSKLKNTDIKYENGSWVARLVATDEKGNAKINQDGSYVYEKYNDKGVLKDSVSLDDFNTGKFYNSFIKKTDTPAVIKKIASNLDPTFQVTDNGVTKHTITFFNDKQKGALNSYVDSYFSQPENVADFLYQNQSGDTWKEPMTMEEYKKNGGLETAKSILKNQVESAFGFKNQTDMTLKTPKGDGGDDNSKGLFVFQPSGKPRYEIGKVGKKRTGGYQIALSTLSGKAMAQGMDKPVIMGRTATGERYLELALSGGEGETGKSGSGVGESSRQSSKGGASGRIYLTGDKADAARAEQYLNYISYKGKKVNSLETLVQIIDNAGKSNKISQSDFNSKWAKLKSGQSLVGPDGKKYTKK